MTSSLNPFDPTLQAFNSDIFPVGIDLRRSVINNDLGIYVADPNATFRAGQVLAQESSGQFTVCDGLGSAPNNIPFGFAKWNKLTSLTSVSLDEPQILTGVVVNNLNNANLYGAPGPGFVRVSSTPTGTTGTTYVEGTDYTINYTNGTIVRINSGAIPSGGLVYVTYQYSVPNANLDFQGRNFWNFLDEVTQAQGRISIITNWTLLFTTAYDPAATYTLGAVLNVGDIAAGIGGLLTTKAGGRPAFGKVFQLPSASDPFLGVVSPGHS